MLFIQSAPERIVFFSETLSKLHVPSHSNAPLSIFVRDSFLLKELGNDRIGGGGGKVVSINRSRLRGLSLLS